MSGAPVLCFSYTSPFNNRLMCWFLLYVVVWLKKKTRFSFARIYQASHAIPRVSLFSSSNSNVTFCFNARGKLGFLLLTAMAVQDDMKEGSISSLIVDSLESNRSGDVLSPEDLAWVDSCLIKDPEDSNWKALKDPLLEIVDSQPESPSYSAAMFESSPEGTDMEIIPSSEVAETSQFPRRNDDDIVSAAVNSGKSKDSYDINKRFISQLLEDDHVETYVTDPFLPSHTDGETLSEVFDSGLGSDLLALEMDPLSEDIFKVWDLDVPAEEDEFLKQLSKALVDTSILPSQLNNTLVDTSIQPSPSTLEDSGAWKDLKDDSLDNMVPLDNLIAAIADLSLNQNSS